MFHRSEARDSIAASRLPFVTKMALRIFVDPDGQQWRVWNVQPSLSGRAVRPAFQRGWLCFERLDGSGRCRLSAADAPEDWEALADERLDLLRRLAESEPQDR